MRANDVAPTRLRAAQRSVETFVNKLPSRFRLGLVLFSGTVEVVSGPVGSGTGGTGVTVPVPTKPGEEAPDEVRREPTQRVAERRDGERRPFERRCLMQHRDEYDFGISRQQRR